MDVKEYSEWQERHVSLESRLSKLSDEEIIAAWGAPRTWNTKDENGQSVDLSDWFIPTGPHVRVGEIEKNYDGNFCYFSQISKLAIEVTNQTTSGKTKRYIRTVVN